jgi:hypothetical protein
VGSKIGLNRIRGPKIAEYNDYVTIFE